MENFSKELGGRCTELCGHWIYPQVLGEVYLGNVYRFGSLNRSYNVSYLKQIVVLYLEAEAQGAIRTAHRNKNRTKRKSIHIKKITLKT